MVVNPLFPQQDSSDGFTITGNNENQDEFTESDARQALFPTVDTDTVPIISDVEESTGGLSDELEKAKDNILENASGNQASDGGNLDVNIPSLDFSGGLTGDTDTSITDGFNPQNAVEEMGLDLSDFGGGITGDSDTSIFDGGITGDSDSSIFDGVKNPFKNFNSELDFNPFQGIGKTVKYGFLAGLAALILTQVDSNGGGKNGR